MRFFVLSLLTGALIFIFGFTVFAQAKHPFTFEDMMKLKRVGEPEVSPDGKWVIFSVVAVNLDANTKMPHIWIVPTAGGAEREIIADRDADRPRWAPDGKRFAFISTKEQGSQVWIADFDGIAGAVSAVWRLTSVATEAGGELWSPDGKNIVFTSDVYPECDGEHAQEDSCNGKKLNEANKSKVKAQMFTRLLYRHWNAYKEGKRSHIFVVRAINGMPNVGDQLRPVPRDLTPGDYDAPVFSLGGQDDYAFSPDGREICYTSNHDSNQAASTNNDLWIVPVTGGPATNITADNPASDSTPLYSPDGNYIAYRAQQRPGYESDRFRLMLYDRKTGVRRDLTFALDAWVGTFAWSPDSSGLYFVAENKGQSPIYSLAISRETIVAAAGGDVTIHNAKIDIKTLLPNGFNNDLAATPDGKLFYTSMSLERPTEISYLSTARCSNEESTSREAPAGLQALAGRDFKYLLCLVNPLTKINDAVLSQLAMSPLESFWFPGANGDKVQGLLVKPPNFEASTKYPVKFLIHGGPQGAWGDDWSYRWNPELFAANGYLVIMINFHGSTGYGQKFIDAINGDWGGAPYEDLMKGLDYAEKTYPFIDKDRECALGASYGGYAINWILGHTRRFKCLVSHDGMFNAESAWGTTEELWFNDWEFKGTPYDNRAMYQKWSPHQYAKNFKTPTLVIHGQRDYRLDVSEGFQLFTTLQMEGVPSKMLYFPDEGHWVLKPQNSRLWYETVNAWVDQWTKK
jgi:dipeptidyl aminopeptidase/acylaminoacyl peptidase